MQPHVLVEEQVAEFQVSVNDLLSVHVPRGLDELGDAAAGLDVREALATLDHLVEREVGAEAEDDVHVLLVLEVGQKLNNALPAQGSVDFDLGHELSSSAYLLLRTALRQRRFYNYFGSEFLSGSHVCDFITFRKSSLIVNGLLFLGTCPCDTFERLHCRLHRRPFRL